MLFGMDGVELSLIIVFSTLFLSILSGYPVAFGLSGAAVVSFAIIALLNEWGLLLVENEQGQLIPVLNNHLGLAIDDINAWVEATRTLAQWGSNTYIRAFGENQNDTLLAVPLFVLMGIALERSKIAEELLTSMGKLFGGAPGGLAVSVVAVGALLAASTGIVGATVVTMGLISLPTMLKAGYSKPLATGVIATSGTLGQVIPPSIVLVLLGAMVGDIYSKAQKARSEALNIPLPELLGSDIAISTGTLFKAAFIPGIVLALLYAAYAFGIALYNPKLAPPIGNDIDKISKKNQNKPILKKLFNIITISFIGIFFIFFFAKSLNIIGTQEKPEDALKFSSFQALFERIGNAKPDNSISNDDFETLRKFVILKSRNKDIPLELLNKWTSLAEGINPDDIIKTLRINEFETRKNDLITGLSRFSNAIIAMLGEKSANQFLEMLSAANKAETVTQLSEAVSNAPRGTEIQKLVRSALESFDFSPFILAENNYNDVLSKSRRKNFKSLDDGQKLLEFESRQNNVLRAAKDLVSFYGNFISSDFKNTFNEDLLLIKSSIDLNELVKNIRKLPTGSKLKRILDPAKQVLDKDALMASSFSYERAVRAVSNGEVNFGISVPVEDEAANLIRLAYTDLGDGIALKELGSYLNSSLENYKTPFISTSMAVFCLICSLVLIGSIPLATSKEKLPIYFGIFGVLLTLYVSITYVGSNMAPWSRLMYYLFPLIFLFYGLKKSIPFLLQIEVIRVVVPPVVLIIAVLGSIFGGVTNPTPAAALGAGGALLLAAIKLLSNKTQLGPLENKSGRQFLLLTTLSIILMLTIKWNFLDDDELIGFGRTVATNIAIITYIISMLGIFYALIILLTARTEGVKIETSEGLFDSIKSWLLSKDRLLPSILQETAKVSVMVFAILIGSQLLALTLRSFGGEEYIENFLHSFEDPRVLLLVVMIVLFFLGFVLDFIEIIFIVIPIVGPVVYAADPAIMPPEWITILIAVNLQTSFITPPFGFALFYLRGVAPKNISTLDIYKGIFPFVIIQIIGLTILWFFPQIVTFLPDLLPDN
ncbi:MAG: TRAP transporter large permease subunit [Paracoccaceae bacterium]